MKTDSKETNQTRDYFSNLRKEYKLEALSEEAVSSDPYQLFTAWFNKAVEANVEEPNAMALSTANKEGTPSSRMVLLKEFTPQGFIFFTNYNSRKALELNERNDAALLFYWSKLERQIRVEGKVTKLDPQSSDCYFAARPRAAQLGALASNQSMVVTRRDLDDALKRLEKEYDGKEIPRPAHWGGMILKPHLFEFWQGRENRLHDRILYKPRGELWNIERLAP